MVTKSPFPYENISMENNCTFYLRIKARGRILSRNLHHSVNFILPSCQYRHRTHLDEKEIIKLLLALYSIIFKSKIKYKIPEASSWDLKEARAGFEPAITVLQTGALPLGDRAIY